MEELQKVLEGLLGAWGPAAQILLWMGVLRVVFKPTFTYLATVVQATPSDKDDKILASVMASPIYKGVAWVIDFLGSIKLPGAKK